MTAKSFIQKIRYGSNFHKPYYMYKMVSNVIKRRYLGQTPLRGIDFAVDYKCNLKCEHCFNKSLVKNRKKMERQDYARVIGQAVELGAVNFAFQGGELFLVEGFENILKLVDSKRYSLSVTTNGFLLDEDMLIRLKGLGVNTVTLSLDSGLDEEHDRFRGRDGAFAAVMRAIDLALGHGIKVVINSTVTPASLRSEGFRKLIDFSKTKKLMINTIFAAPSGKWSNNEEIILQDEDIKLYYEKVKGNPFVVRDVDSGYAVRGCQGGTESLYITPYGDVLPCPYIHISAGNIFKEELNSIRERAMRYYHYQERCLISEDRNFIDQYLQLTKDHDLPLSEEYLEKITAWD